MANATQITAPEGTPFIDIVREFDAPVEAVFKAHTDPAIFPLWQGPASVPLELNEFDATPGGRWQYTSRPADYPEFFFRGVFHTVEPNNLIIQTFEFSLAPNLVGVDTTTFEALEGGRTRLTLHELYPSAEARDMALQSGMEYGINEGYERLDAVLAK